MEENTAENLKHFFMGGAITLLTAGMIYLIFFSNILTTYAGVDNYRYGGNHEGMTDTSIEEPVLFEINGKRVIYTPNLPEGIAGTHQDIIEDSIQIGSGRGLKNIKETCEHELLHEKGASVNGEHKPGDYIYEMDGYRNTETCIRFIYELGRWNAKN